MKEKEAKAPTRRRICPTSLTYTTDYDTTYLKDVYVNGIKFTRNDREGTRKD